jgi:hypothetical protein
MFRIFVVACVMALASSVAAAQQHGARVFYIDYDSGSDRNDGRSPERPFRHAPGDPAAEHRARGTQLRAGDTVLFRGGVNYRGQIEVKWSGTPDAPIVYDGNSQGTFGNGRAVIDGADPITGWQRVASQAEARGNPDWQNLWVARIADDIDVFTANLTQGDQLMALARDPQLNDPFFMDEMSTMRNVLAPAVQHAEDESHSWYVDPRVFTQQDPEYWRGAYMVLWVHDNRIRYIRVLDYDPAEHRIRTEHLRSQQQPGERGRFAMINVLGAIARPGDYFVDPEPDAEGNRRIYAWPHEVGPNGPQDMGVSRRADGFHLRDQAHVTIQGFLIQNQGGARAHGVSIPSGGRHVTILDNEIRFGLSQSGLGAGIGIYTNSRNIVIENNEVHRNRRARGMRLTFDDSVVTRNRLAQNGSTGIGFYTAKRSEMTRNVVLDHRGVHANGLTIYAHSDDILVEGNIVRDGGHAFTVQDSANVTVRNNILHANGPVVGIWSGYHRNLRFEHNVIVGADRGPAWAAGLTTSPRGMEVDGLHVHNNILAGTMGTLPGNFSHNIYTRLGENDQEDRLPEGSVYVDAPERLFMNPAEHDYRPRPGSPAIDAGRDVGVPRDIEGTSRPQGSAPDIGAYESQAG